MTGDVEPAPAQVSSDEVLARFIFQSNHLRADRTLRPAAFMPNPVTLELSVVRHLALSDQQIWSVATFIATTIEKHLYARADLKAEVFQAQRLRVVPAAEINNPNHANVADWPSQKPAQMVIAQEISAVAGAAVLPPSA